MRNRNRSKLCVLHCLAFIALGLAWAHVARAQDKPDGLFDKPASAKKAEAPKEAPKEKPQAKPSAGTVTDRDSIEFSQENVASQMTELEERMFRLSEALRNLEPENASRLKLALKFSREELILQQMKDTQKLLKEAQVAKAETEVRELLAKLEHLRNLLLAENLDFQLKLARLRQMREALGQLERIIKEERREWAWSRSAIERAKQLGPMRALQAELEKLVRDQDAILAATRDISKKEDDAARTAARTAAREHEVGVRKKAAELASNALLADQEPPYLKQADTHVGDALTSLEAPDLPSAAGSAEQALALFRKELERLEKRIAETQQSLVEEEFRRFEADQAKNRAATDTLGTVSARLGDAGVAFQKDLIHASSSMQDAEGELARTKAEPAADDQQTALKHLDKSHEGLGQAMEKLLTEIRTELQARIIAELTDMHDRQASIRETTEAQAPRVAQKSRTAEVTVVGLSKKEGELGEQTGQLLALVEETAFGIALPTSLRVIKREMSGVEGWLKAADTSKRTIVMEKRIEEDLLGLLQAMRRLPPTTPPPPGAPLPSNLLERERELNRLVAELKMIRLLQSRLNDDTLDVDKSRPEGADLTAELKQDIDSLKSAEEEIRDSLAKIGLRLEQPGASDFPSEPGKIEY